MSNLKISTAGFTGVTCFETAIVTPDGSGVVTIDYRVAAILAIADGSDLRGIQLTDNGTPWEPSVGGSPTIMIKAQNTSATVHVEDPGVSAAYRIVAPGGVQSSFTLMAAQIQAVYDVVAERWKIPDWVGVPRPTGQMIAYAPAGPVPPGYFECDGAAVSRTTYWVLFSVLGTTYGDGDGVNTFNVPSPQHTPGVSRWLVYAAQ